MQPTRHAARATACYKGKFTPMSLLLLATTPCRKVLACSRSGQRRPSAGCLALPTACSSPGLSLSRSPLLPLPVAPAGSCHPPVPPARPSSASACSSPSDHPAHESARAHALLGSRLAGQHGQVAHQEPPLQSARSRCSTWAAVGRRRGSGCRHSFISASSPCGT